MQSTRYKTFMHIALENFQILPTLLFILFFIIFSTPDTDKWVTLHM